MRLALVPDGGETEPHVTVLIADDDDAMRETLKIWLRDDRWRVREAVDGKDALEKLDDTIDILVLDRSMPELSGAEVANRLEETPFTGVVIVVSAYKPDEQLDEEDATVYLTKPFERDQFITQLQQTLP